MKKFLYTICSLLVTTCVIAQDSVNTNPSPDGLRADGKIYVVAAVLLTILLGILVYILRLDQKISKLEKQKD